MNRFLNDLLATYLDTTNNKCEHFRNEKAACVKSSLKEFRENWQMNENFNPAQFKECDKFVTCSYHYIIL